MHSEFIDGFFFFFSLSFFLLGLSSGFSQKHGQVILSFELKVTILKSGYALKVLSNEFVQMFSENKRRKNSCVLIVCLELIGLIGSMPTSICCSRKMLDFALMHILATSHIFPLLLYSLFLNSTQPIIMSWHSLLLYLLIGLQRLNIYAYVDCSTSSVSSVIAKLAHYFKEEVVVFFL